MSRSWQKPITTKLYVHPPKAERVFTFWREGKLVFGEMQNPITDYDAQVSSLLWFVDGDASEFDFRDAKFIMHPRGIPVHTLTGCADALTFTVETFASCERKPACYVKLRLENKTAETICEKFGFILKTGFEKDLCFGAPDNYGPYAPKTEYLDTVAPTWCETADGYQDGERTLTVKGEIPFVFDSEKGLALAQVTLKPGEAIEEFFVFGIGDFSAGNYEAEKAKTLAYWENELKRINKLPDKIQNNPEQVKVIENLVVQLLQCFSYAKDGDALLPRQGGLQRQIWTGEAHRVLEALPRIGDFDDYVAPVIDTYFNVFWTETGEVVPFGLWWAQQTGNVLYSFSDYAMTRDKAYFNKYREKAIKSFEWMCKTRASTEDGELTVKGLFPALRSCDAEYVFQNWGMTDGNNIYALRNFLKACEYFEDEITPLVKAELDDYLSIMKMCWARRVAQSPVADEYQPFYAPLGDNELYANKYVFNPSTCYLIDSLDVDPEDCLKYINYLERRHLAHDGLYNKMPVGIGAYGSMAHSFNNAGKSVVWYVSYVEYSLFRYLMRHGMEERAEQILLANYKYAMTPDYYMLERFHEDTPYFTPWLPNASANGRLISMIMDFYGRE